MTERSDTPRTVIEMLRDPEYMKLMTRDQLIEQVCRHWIRRDELERDLAAREAELAALKAAGAGDEIVRELKVRARGLRGPMAECMTKAAARIVSDAEKLAAREEELAAKDATIERLLMDSEAAHAHITALRDDRLRLQQALYFWMPSIAGEETPAGERAAKDAFLLISLDLKDEPSAYELGWIVMDSEAKLLRDERNLAEQRAEAAERKAEESARDAARYRFIRDDDNWQDDAPDTATWDNLGELSMAEFDAAVDKKMSAAYWEKNPIQAAIEAEGA